MSKGFKIILAIIFIILIGIIIPAYLIDGRSWETPLDLEIRKALNPIENLVVLKISDENVSWSSGVNLYTWFGLKYATAEKLYDGCDLSICYKGVVINRFWTQKDNYKY